MAVTTWQLDASYRGAAFYVQATEDEFARRGAHHQFPQRDKGVWEDLGKYGLAAHRLRPGRYDGPRLPGYGRHNPFRARLA